MNSTESFTDTYWSIFEISALLNEYLMKNSVVNSHKPNKINAICLILDLFFRISYTNQKLMAEIIINILEREVKKKSY